MTSSLHASLKPRRKGQCSHSTAAGVDSRDMEEGGAIIKIHREDKERKTEAYLAWWHPQHPRGRTRSWSEEWRGRREGVSSTWPRFMYIQCKHIIDSCNLPIMVWSATKGRTDRFSSAAHAPRAFILHVSVFCFFIANQHKFSLNVVGYNNQLNDNTTSFYFTLLLLIWWW